MNSNNDSVGNNNKTNQHVDISIPAGQQGPQINPQGYVFPGRPPNAVPGATPFWSSSRELLRSNQPSNDGDGQNNRMENDLAQSSIDSNETGTQPPSKLLKLDPKNKITDFRVLPATNDPAASPAQHRTRRKLQSRPLQTATNNNTIINQTKRKIQNVVLSDKPSPQRRSYHEESTVKHSAPNWTPAFTATKLSVGTSHAVYCSYVEDGPDLFWVSLRSQEHCLDRMSTELENSPRNPITITLSIGMACMARFSKDHLLHRAVIQKIQSGGCHVTFIDYGNSEFVAFADMYEIPNHFMEPKSFAMSFQLYGCRELGEIDDPLREFFNSLVGHEHTLDLRVIPTGNVYVEQCELFTANGNNILDLLKEKKLSLFQILPHLKSDDYVVIRAALTANKLYVQRVADIPAFDEMMEALFVSCSNTPPMASLPANGKCCVAMANGNTNKWYRAIVLNQLDSQRVRVQFVDYGNEMACGLSDLRELAPPFLSPPRQAIECCLVDFKDVTDVPKTTGKQLTMLINDVNDKTIEYKASVKERLSNGKYVVDLYNAAEKLSVSLSVYNVTVPRISKLDTDCFFYWLGWLSLKELKKLRRTCKYMKQAVDYYITKEANYQSSEVRQMIIKDFDSIENADFDLINHLEIWSRKFTESQIDEKKQLLGHVDRIEVTMPLKNCDFRDLMKYCTHVKYLKLNFFDEREPIANENGRIHQHYPTLEHIEFDSCEFTGSEMKTFFELNPQIQSYSCFFGYLEQTYPLTWASDIKLERLDIHYSGSENIENVCNLLKGLHSRGFYKRLHVFFEDGYWEEEVQQIATLPALEYLYALHLNFESSNLLSLANLKELAVDRRVEVENLELLINSMPNIQRIQLRNNSINEILPLIQRCPKLGQLKIRHLRQGLYFENGIIDLLMLNKEREKLPNARKIRIFVQEDVFLKNKWRQEINLSLIELKNAHLWERSEPFLKFEV